MIAEQLKQKATDFLTNDTGSQYGEILSLCEKAAAKGEFEVHYYKNIREQVREKLEAEGLVVGKTSFHMNETLTHISWK